MKTMLLIALLLLPLLLMGCTQPNPNDQGGQGGQFGSYDQGGGPGSRNGNFSGRFGNGTSNGTFGNLTDTQKQQLMQQRIQQEIGACNGKNEGDTCTITSQRRSRDGMCAMLNSTLRCNVPFPSGRPSGFPAQ